MVKNVNHTSKFFVLGSSDNKMLKIFNDLFFNGYPLNFTFFEFTFFILSREVIQESVSSISVQI